MSGALELQNVTKVYKSGRTEFVALHPTTLTIAGGELVAIMGPSGSGKSTLLTIAGGLETPTSGTILVNGVDTSAMSRDQRATFRRRSVGYVFQDLNLLTALTCEENVSLPLELDGVSARHARKLAHAALEQVGMMSKAKSFPDDLSGGERQRTAIARAIVESPSGGSKSSERASRLLLADEPTGALDSVNGDVIMRILSAACRRGAAVVIVTHDAHLAAWADRIVFLRDGRIVDATAAPHDSPLLATSPGTN
jgi:putative ABC transport system ATP-binding protein